MSELDLETVKGRMVEDHIAIVTLDNPPVNAHSPQMLEDITTMFDRLSDIDEVRAVVLTGEGKIFCAGADICLLYTSPSPRDATLSRMPSSA